MRITLVGPVSWLRDSIELYHGFLVFVCFNGFSSFVGCSSY